MPTILAIATPPGRGGVGILRLSGTKALQLALTVSQRLILTPRFAHFATFYACDGSILDQGLLLYFKAPHSFTGEDVVEFHCHGAPVVLDLLTQTLLQYGAELAKPGEFSLRAYLNDKMDLTQAEAIADLIQAESTSAARLAMRTLQGEFSQRIAPLHQRLIYLRSYVESALDFPEEDIDFLAEGKIAEKLRTLEQDVRALRALAVQGSLIREGLTLVITGRPNAGKSSLMNYLAQRDVAIVTPVPGTTRDVLQEHLLLDDIPLQVLDTAGLRVTADLVEQAGIARAYKAIENADCVIIILDSSAHESHEKTIVEIKSTIPVQIPVILVYNKIDLWEGLPQKKKGAVYVSLKNGQGLDLLKTAIKEAVGYQPQSGLFLARRRHLEALDQVLAYLTEASLATGGELMAEALRLTHLALGQITGEFTSDDLLGNIFANFCIGK